jgi:hypothetical protein
MIHTRMADYTFMTVCIIITNFSSVTDCTVKTDCILMTNFHPSQIKHS